MKQDVILSMVGREEECTGKKIDTEIKKVRGKTRGVRAVKHEESSGKE